MISFECTCGQSVRVDDRLAGRLGRCPRCGETVRVPAGRAAVPPPLPSGEAEPGPSDGPVARPAEAHEPAPAAPPVDGDAQQLEFLRNLQREGLIGDEEVSAQRARILGRPGVESPPTG